MSATNKNGFTIVELTIVIAVIAILVAVSFGLYRGAQDRARSEKINNDVGMLERAIVLARASVRKPLRDITTSTATISNCIAKPSGFNFASANKTTDTCWVSYNNALDAISFASGSDVRNLQDPWGRPYYIDENEDDPSVTTACAKDVVGALPFPNVQNDWSATNARQIEPIDTSDC